MTDYHKHVARLAELGVEGPEGVKWSNKAWYTGDLWGFYDGDEPLMACSESRAIDLHEAHYERWWLGRGHNDGEFRCVEKFTSEVLLTDCHADAACKRARAPTVAEALIKALEG